MLKLVVFDLDGTLVDSRRDLADAIDRLIVGHGGRPLGVDAVVHMVGEGAATLIERAFRAAGLEVTADALPRFLELYGERLTVYTRPYPGVPEMLELLEPCVPLAVLTNKPGRLSERLLEQLELACYFRRVQGGDGPYPRKPDPGSLRALMTEFDAHPDEALMVGDSKFDVRTARAAGVRVALVRYGFGFADVPAGDATDAAAVVDSPAALVEWLAREGRLVSR